MKKSLAHRMPNTITLLAAAACLVSTVGCSLLATTMWVINPNDTKAEYDGLQHKRVAVICKGDGALPYHNYAVTQMLADQVTMLLGTNVDDIDVVKQSEITDWTDHNEMTSPAELGSAMAADVVMVIKLADFRVRQGSTMLQGRAQVDVEIHDAASGDVLHRIGPIDSTYPPNNGVPADLSNSQFENRFRSQFANVLAHQIARRFYDHDSRADLKIDRYYQED